MKKVRLDKILVSIGLAQSRERARALIMAGKVLVNLERVDKPGALVSPEAPITLKGEDIPYVSRGGLKLEAALSGFNINCTDLDCIDIGASTGGFTDCLLQHGAGRVYAVDVGYGQLAWKLRKDPRVVVIERTNIRHLPKNALPSPVDLAVIDVSFISLRIVVPAALQFLKQESSILALVKPQFEVGKGHVGKGGVVRDQAIHESVIQDLVDFFKTLHLTCRNVLPSPVLGPKGNKEFVLLLERNPPSKTSC